MTREMHLYRLHASLAKLLGSITVLRLAANVADFNAISTPSRRCAESAPASFPGASAPGRPEGAFLLPYQTEETR